MDVKALETLIKIMKDNGIQEIEVQEGETKYRVVQATPFSGQAPHPFAFPAFPSAPMMQVSHAVSAEGSAIPAAAATPAVSKLHTIRSPFVGTFYESPSPGSDAFVQVGQRVKKGDTLCIIEAMKLMNEIEADRDGVLVEILVPNESPVEYDQELFRIE